MSTTTDAYDAPAGLQGRARRLRQQAASLSPLLAETYRRRAAELDLQALLEAVFNPSIDLRFAAEPQAPRAPRALVAVAPVPLRG